MPCRSRPAPGFPYHDHWLALVALCARRARLRRPPALRLRPARRRRRSGTPVPTPRRAGAGRWRTRLRAAQRPAVGWRSHLLPGLLPAGAGRDGPAAALRRPAERPEAAHPGALPAGRALPDLALPGCWAAALRALAGPHRDAGRRAQAWRPGSPGGTRCGCSSLGREPPSPMAAQGRQPARAATSLPPRTGRMSASRDTSRPMSAHVRHRAGGGSSGRRISSPRRPTGRSATAPGGDRGPRPRQDLRAAGAQGRHDQGAGRSTRSRRAEFARPPRASRRLLRRSAAASSSGSSGATAPARAPC